ncbi:MAG: O-antigen ligase family protein [Candidatus Limnocylindrales bacterium]
MAIPSTTSDLEPAHRALRPLGGSLPSGPHTLLHALIASAIALAPAFASAVLPAWASWPLALAVGGVLAVVAWIDTVPLSAALILTTAVAESALVPDAGRALPALTLAVPLCLAVLTAERADLRVLARPPRTVILTAIVYLAAMVASIVASTLSGWRPNYPLVLLGATALGLVLGLVILPHLGSSVSARRALLVTFATLGPLLVAASLLLQWFGPIYWQGTWLGAWVQAELTIGSHPTGFVFARASGPFERPAGASTILAVSALAMLALLGSLKGVRRAILILGLVVVEIALAITLNRDGWLIMAAGGMLMAAVAAWHRRLDLWSAATGLVFVAILVAVTLNVVGANIRPDAAVARYGAAIAATLPGADEDSTTRLRGGSGLSGREYLWQASDQAIRERPLLGWGLGSDQTVIGPLLPAEAQRFVGLTSDSMWLVTATEIGLLGLGALLLFCLASALAIVRRLLSRQAPPDATAIAMGAAFFALLAGATFETYRLGWLIYPSLEVALAVGLTISLPAVVSQPAAVRALEQVG